MYEKDFDSWNRTKKQINAELRPKQFIRAGEVRWATLGVNIGSEIDGKGHSFTRPVIVVHAGNHMAMVVPLSTKVKTLPGYSPFRWKQRAVSICIHQTRVVSQKRLLRRIGHLPGSRLKQLKKEISEYFSLN